MITQIQRQWLQDILDGKITRKDDPHKWSVYMKRIRERVDEQIENGEWLAEYMPEILEDAEWEIQRYGMLKRRRLKSFYKIIKLLYPEGDVELTRMRAELQWP